MYIKMVTEFYFYDDQIKENDVGGMCTMYSGDEKFLQVLVRKSECLRLFERPRRMWVSNIEMDLKRIVRTCVDWNNLAQIISIGGLL
jgi:hypothetical protein